MKAKILPEGIAVPTPEKQELKKRKIKMKYFENIWKFWR